MTNQEIEEAYLNCGRAIIEAQASTIRVSGRLERDEMESEGLVAFMNACKTYDPSYGTAFSTYCMGVVKNAMVSLARKMALQQSHEIETEPYSDDDNRSDEERMSASVASCCADAYEIPVGEWAASKDAVHQIEMYIALLPADEQLALTYSIESLSPTGKAESQAYIGGVLGVSQVYVSKLLKKARQKLALQLNYRPYQGKSIN